MCADLRLRVSLPRSCTSSPDDTYCMYHRSLTRIGATVQPYSLRNVPPPSPLFAPHAMRLQPPSMDFLSAILHFRCLVILSLLTLLSFVTSHIIGSICMSAKSTSFSCSLANAHECGPYNGTGFSTVMYTFR